MSMKQTNLKFKTQPKQLLGHLPLDIVHHSGKQKVKGDSSQVP